MAPRRITQSSRKPRLAVWKFASCDGCQLSLLNCEDQLLSIADHVQIAYFPEASRSMGKPPYDLSLVEGAISTPDDRKRIQEVRRASKMLVAIGACATAGGIQALRNFSGGEAFASMVYPRPELLDVLPTCTPLSSHVRVDLELRGCPVSKKQLLETVSAWLHGRKPTLPRYSVCIECKRDQTTCLMVARRLPCLGPVTQAGCGAICPRFGRGCYGCFGPKETANVASLKRLMATMGIDHEEILRGFSTFNAYAEEFREEG
ncbi:MAG: oxidoreductase [Syntrophobacteraceae bacterium]